MKQILASDFQLCITLTQGRNNVAATLYRHRFNTESTLLKLYQNQSAY